MFAILKLYKLKYKYELVDFNNDSNSLLDRFLEVTKKEPSNKTAFKNSINNNGYCMYGNPGETCMFIILNVSYLMTNKTKGLQGYKTAAIDKYYVIEDLAKQIMPEIREILISKTFNDPFYIK